MFDLKEQLKILPDRPGVYLMKNIEQEIIYVGKAISLKNRVRQYFQSSRNQPPKVRAMVAHITSFEYIVTDSELEALILECNLIKKHRPKYNVLLRDDKTYPYIKVTLGESYPRIIKTRRVVKDKSKYFGPYTNVGALNETINIIHQLYPIRSCNKNIEKMIERGERPCLNYHIKKCMGPCRGPEGKEEYNQMIQEIIMILNGKEAELIKKIQEKMKEASANMNFEEAARYRNQLWALESTLEKQKIVTDQRVDQDVIALAEADHYFLVIVFFIREGKLIHQEKFTIDRNEEETREEALTAFVKQYYGENTHVPKEILLEHQLEEAPVLEQWLSGKRGSKVELKVPVRGDKRRLLEMVQKNAQTVLNQTETIQRAKPQERTEELKELQALLNLEEFPNRIESYDISNIQGLQSVGSMIVFEGGKPNNKSYRRFKIKTVTGPDDYGSLEEILTRRFTRGIRETQEIIEGAMTLQEGKFSIFPDLILVDGGFGQVTSVKKALAALSLDIPVCGMIKDDKHKTRGLAYEGQEIILPKNTPLFRLIYKIQEEVHRFALSYHKTLRKKDMLQSELENIKGIGEAKRKALMKHFKNIKGIKEASIEALMEVKGITRALAEDIQAYFNEENHQDGNKK
ncbi:excinuclease ABC subunit UvrC [Alkaliphilus crotonatoxidans]